MQFYQPVTKVTIRAKRSSMGSHGLSRAFGLGPNAARKLLAAKITTGQKHSYLYGDAHVICKPKHREGVYGHSENNDQKFKGRN